MIGMPLVYRHVNPTDLNATEKLDCYPALGNPKCVNIWIATELSNPFQNANFAWQEYLDKFDYACRRRGLQAFLPSTTQRNDKERIRNYLAPLRRKVRDYIEPLGLVSLPVFRTGRVYTRTDRLWTLQSFARFTQLVPGVEISNRLVKRNRWIRTHKSEFVGSQSWYKWLRPGMVKVGWSTARTESWLWYEITCPYQPSPNFNGTRLTTESFTEAIDEVWLPIISNIRWRTTSNLRVNDL